MSREDEYIPAVISAERSKADNCCCNMCHGLGYVTKLNYPTTAYYKTGNGNERQLSQHRNEIWICDECINKIIFVIGSTLEEKE